MNREDVVDLVVDLVDVDLDVDLVDVGLEVDLVLAFPAVFQVFGHMGPSNLLVRRIPVTVGKVEVTLIERAIERATERASDRATERVTERPSDRSSDRPSDRAIDRTD